MSKTRFVGLACVLMLAASLSGCGSGGSTSAAAPLPPPPSGGGDEDGEPIQGVAIPSNVSVVTATNAN